METICPVSGSFAMVVFFGSAERQSFFDRCQEDQKTNEMLVRVLRVPDALNFRVSVESRQLRVRLNCFLGMLRLRRRVQRLP